MTRGRSAGWSVYHSAVTAKNVFEFRPEAFHFCTEVEGVFKLGGLGGGGGGWRGVEVRNEDLHVGPSVAQNQV